MLIPNSSRNDRGTVLSILFDINLLDMEMGINISLCEFTSSIFEFEIGVGRSGLNVLFVFKMNIADKRVITNIVIIISFLFILIFQNLIYQ
jgi:hypothetical protein